MPSMPLIPVVCAEFSGIHADELMKTQAPFIVGFDKVDELFMSAHCFPVDDKHTRTFTYECHDSDEGTVQITYADIHEIPVQGWDKESVFDVVVTTASDVWDLAATQRAINYAIALHRHLGRDKPFGPYKDR